MDFAIPVDHRVKLDLAREPKMTVEHEGDIDTNWFWVWSPKVGKKTGGIGNQRKNLDYPDNIFKILIDLKNDSEEFWRLEETCCHSDLS